MVQSHSWEANWFAASQEILRISRNPKVHYRTHKRPPPVSILGQPNPVHIPTSHILEIHPNIIHPSTPRSSQWSPSLWFPHQDPIHPPPLTHTRYMPNPSHSSRFYHPHKHYEKKCTQRSRCHYPRRYSLVGYWTPCDITSAKLWRLGTAARMGYKLRRRVVGRWPFVYRKHYPSVCPSCSKVN